MFNFRSLFCPHEFELVGKGQTMVNNVTFKNFLFTEGYCEWNTSVMYYICKKCGKVKRVVIK